MSTQHDGIALLVGGRRIERFIRYRVDMDLYCADHGFELELKDPGFDISPGAVCKLLVNDQLTLTGIVDRAVDGDDKHGSTLRIEGRDLMGILVDSYVTEFPDLEGVSLKDLAERLLTNTPHINRKRIRYQGGVAGTVAGTATDSAAGAMAAFGLEKSASKVEPGQTIFEVLKPAAVSRGAMFFCLPDGTFVFGRPKAAGKPVFSITHGRTGKGNNAFRTKRMRDNSRRYSSITVIGQQQGNDELSAGEINVSATVEDSDAPFYKPYVTVLNDDDKSPEEYARMLMEMQKAESFQLCYYMRGHSQNGKNFTLNELARVRDGKRRIDGSYLIYGMTLELDRREGPFTALQLGYPGVVR